MSNPDRLPQDHAESLFEDRGEANARAWIIHCANRSTDGFWSRVLQAFEALVDEHEAIAAANDEKLATEDAGL